VDDLQIKVDEGMARVDKGYENVENWWDGLSEREQNNPLNQAKYETANRALGKASGVLTSVDGALNDENESTVQYPLEKTLKDKWNFVIGSQFQFNKHWMIRAEVGFLGSRKQIMGGLQYRLGL
jgi:hypothetical protein